MIRFTSDELEIGEQLSVWVTSLTHPASPEEFLYAEEDWTLTEPGTFQGSFLLPLGKYLVEGSTETGLHVEIEVPVGPDPRTINVEATLQQDS